MQAGWSLPPELSQRFRLTREISRGGMGIVYEVLDLSLNRPAALKVILQSSDPRSLQRFQREATALAQLKHRNIVTVQSAGSSQGLPYLLMDFIDGHPLEQWVRQHLKLHNSPPPLQQSLSLITQIADALTYCHEQGLIHRDIKPSNVLIEKDTDRPVLIDFGLVRKAAGDTVNDETQPLTRTGEVLGTPHYMAPEQLDPEDFGAITDKADVWSLGATLLFCLTGETPYADTSQIEHLAARMTEAPRRAQALNKSVPSWLDQIIDAALAKDPDDRPSAQLFAEKIRAQEGLKEGSRWPARVAVLSILLLAAATSFLIFANEAPRFTLDPDHPKVVNSAVLELSGRVQDEDLPRLRLFASNGAKVTHLKVDADGRFRARLALKQTIQRYALAFKDSRGVSSKPVSLKVRIDTFPARLESLSHPQWTYDKQVTLNGRLSEQGCTLRVGGKTLPVSDHQFTVTVPLQQGLNSIKLEITDAAGNKTNPPALVINRYPELRVAPTGPYRNLRDALKQVKEKARIVIAEGSYRGNVTIQGGQVVELVAEGSRAKTQLINNNTTVIDVVRGHLTMRGLTVEVIGDPDLRFPALTASRNVKLELYNCLLKGPGGGLSVGEALSSEKSLERNLKAEDCEFVGSWSGRLTDRRKGNLRAAVQVIGVVAQFRRCIVRNSAGYGAKATVRARARFEHCQFLKNNDTGLLVQEWSQVEVDQCLFQGNAQEGLLVESGDGPTKTKVVARHCKFLRNGLYTDLTSQYKAWHAAIEGRGHPIVEVADCTLEDNNGAGIFAESDAQLLFKNCRMINNKPHTIVLCNRSRVHAFRCTITDTNDYAFRFKDLKPRLTLEKCDLAVQRMVQFGSRVKPLIKD